MITRDTGILNPEITPAKEVDTNFNAYNDSFTYSAVALHTTVKDARRLAIATLTFSEDMPFQFASYLSRIPIAAHWAEDDGAAYKRATDIYTLHTTAGRYGGQTLLRFLHGSYDDLESGSDSKVEIEVSQLPVFPAIKHGIGPAPAPDGYEALSFVGYGSSVGTSPERQIITRRAGKLIVDKQDTGNEFALARKGTVSVHPSIDNFWDTEYESRHSLVFGNRDAHKTIEKLIGERIRNRLFDPHEPMPDLSFLADSAISKKTSMTY